MAAELKKDWFYSPNMINYHEYFEVEKFFDKESRAIYILDASKDSLSITQICEGEPGYDTEYLDYLEFLGSQLEAEDTSDGFKVTFKDLSETAQARLYRHLGYDIRGYDVIPIATIPAEGGAA